MRKPNNSIIAAAITNTQRPVMKKLAIAIVAIMPVFALAAPPDSAGNSGSKSNSEIANSKPNPGNPTGGNTDRGTGGNVTGGAGSATGGSALGGTGTSGGNVTGGAGSATGDTATAGTDNATSNAAAGAATAASAAGGTYVNNATANVIHERSAHSAIAAALAASNGTCMGSTSAGGQGLSFGLSIGSTWRDESCERRYNAMRLEALGMEKAAVALMCQDATVREAMEVTGYACPPTKAARNATTEREALAKGEYTDPIVRQRLGLPPL